VIEEPTAAAVAYQLHKKAIHHILVYDLGGGTLDVSLLYVAKGAVSVYATDGDDTLGGSDFDHCLAQRLRHLVETRTGRKVPQHVPHYLNHYPDYCSMPVLQVKAEHAKKALSQADSVTVTCVLYGTPEEVQGEVVTVVLERERDFEVQCGPLFDRALLPVSRLLDGLEMRSEEVDEVVLVGGSTRIPHIKHLLRHYFAHTALNDHIDPDITVAFGAATILD